MPSLIRIGSRIYLVGVMFFAILSRSVADPDFRRAVETGLEQMTNGNFPEKIDWLSRDMWQTIHDLAKDSELAERKQVSVDGAKVTIISAGESAKALADSGDVEWSFELTASDPVLLSMVELESSLLEEDSALEQLSHVVSVDLMSWNETPFQHSGHHLKLQHSLATADPASGQTRCVSWNRRTHRLSEYEACQVVSSTENSTECACLTAVHLPIAVVFERYPTSEPTENTKEPEVIVDPQTHVSPKVETEDSKLQPVVSQQDEPKAALLVQQAQTAPEMLDTAEKEREVQAFEYPETASEESQSLVETESESSDLQSSAPHSVLPSALNIGHKIQLALSSWNALCLVVCLLSFSTIYFIGNPYHLGQHDSNFCVINAILGATISNGLLLHYSSITAAECDLKCKVYSLICYYFMQTSAFWIFGYAVQKFRLMRLGHSAAVSTVKVALACYLIPLVLAIAFFVSKEHHMEEDLHMIPLVLFMGLPSLAVLSLGIGVILLCYRDSGSANRYSSDDLSVDKSLSSEFSHPEFSLGRYRVMVFMGVSLVAFFSWLCALCQFVTQFHLSDVLFMAIGWMESVLLLMLFFDKFNRASLTEIVQSVICGKRSMTPPMVLLPLHSKESQLAASTATAQKLAMSGKIPLGENLPIALSVQLDDVEEAMEAA